MSEMNKNKEKYEESESILNQKNGYVISCWVYTEKYIKKTGHYVYTIN
jgi:hypothetical protein